VALYRAIYSLMTITTLICMPLVASAQSHGTAATSAPPPGKSSVKTDMVPSLFVMNARGASLQGQTLTLAGVSPNSIQLWIFVLFLIYETATELHQLFGEGELWHLLVTSRPSELPLNRRQRIRELIRLSNRVDTHPVNEFRDPTSPAHTQLIDIVRRLAVDSRGSPSNER
jgi:hypothetical protein